jgi:hypothetical protein
LEIDSMRNVPRSLLAVVALAPLLLACADEGESAAFVVRLGTDTTAVEVYTRAEDRIDAVSVTRSPRTTRRRLTVWIAPDGSVARYATGGASGDMEEVVPPEGSIPLADGFYLPWELALSGAARSGDAESTVNVLAGESTLPIAMRRGSDGSWRFNTQFDQPVEATVDPDGRMRSFAIAGGGTTVERVATLDLDALEREFAARDAAGQGMGPLSPLDSVSAAVAGAQLTIVYSRPSLRGRPLDLLVPPGQVWRMGANNATSLTTDREIRFGEVRLPPGSYSLFLDRESGGAWTLIVNEQTGMSGLERDPARDVSRVPLAVRTDAEHMDVFTIAVEPDGAGGVLRARWGSVDVSAPFQAG